MSSLGWKVVRFDFEKRWTEAHRAAKVHVHERMRILDGDWSPIIRELEPGFTEGQELVLSSTRATKHAVYDDFGNLTGEVVQVSRLPLFVITIRDVKRHRQGYFRVRFDVLDRRDPTILLRRKPPALREGEYAEATEEEVRQAAIESSYTSNPKQSLDGLSVPLAWQNTLVVQAKERRAQHFADLRRERDEEETRENVKRVHARLKAVMIAEVREGRDPSVLLGRIERELADHEQQIRHAA